MFLWRKNSTQTTPSSWCDQGLFLCLWRQSLCENCRKKIPPQTHSFIRRHCGYLVFSLESKNPHLPQLHHWSSTYKDIPGSSEIPTHQHVPILELPSTPKYLVHWDDIKVWKSNCLRSPDNQILTFIVKTARIMKKLIGCYGTIRAVLLSGTVIYEDHCWMFTIHFMLF